MRRALTAYCTVVHIAHLKPLLSCLPDPAFAMLHRCALRIMSPVSFNISVAATRFNMSHSFSRVASCDASGVTAWSTPS
jgi:hypothetical protein